MRLTWLSAATAGILICTPGNAATILDFEGAGRIIPVTIGTASDYAVHIFDPVFTVEGYQLQCHGYVKSGQPSAFGVSPSVFLAYSLDMRFRRASLDVINTTGSFQSAKLSISIVGGFVDFEQNVAPGTTRITLDMLNYRSGRVLLPSGPIPENPTLFFDNVVLSSFVPNGVPEPALWVTMIGGFGAVGGALRARRRHARVSLASVDVSPRTA